MNQTLRKIRHDAVSEGRMNYGQRVERSKYRCVWNVQLSAICVVLESQSCTDNNGPWHPAGQTGHEVANNVKMSGAEISYLLRPGQGAETGMRMEHCWCVMPWFYSSWMRF